jgi:hypothetical protein
MNTIMANQKRDLPKARRQRLRLLSAKIILLVPQRAGLLPGSCILCPQSAGSTYGDLRP